MTKTEAAAIIAQDLGDTNAHPARIEDHASDLFQYNYSGNLNQIHDDQLAMAVAVLLGHYIDDED